MPPLRDDMPWNEFVATAQRLTLDANGRPVRGADPDQPQTGTVKPAIYGSASTRR